MTKSEIVSLVEQRVGGLVPRSELESIVSGAVRSMDIPGRAYLDPAVEVVSEFAQDASADLSGSGVTGEEQVTVVGEKSMCFLCQYDFDLGELTIKNPYVSLPDGTIKVPEVPSIHSGNTYYCIVKRIEPEDGEQTYEVSISDEQDDDDDVILCVPICKLSDDDGQTIIVQYHVGVLVVGAADVKPADGSGLVVNESGELDLDGREEDDEFKVVELKDKDGEVIAKVLATEEFSLSGGVETLNEKDGKVNIIGGKHIRVESESEQTIKISYDEDKEEEDEDPNAEKDDPCGHPGDKDGGGVKPDDDDGSGGGGGGGGPGGGGWGPGGGGGGVGPDGQGEPHIGDNNCQGCGCS